MIWKYLEQNVLVFTKSVDSTFRAFWLAPVTRNILGYSLFCEQKKLKQDFFIQSDLVNTKTTIPLRVGEERWIYTSTLRVSVYIHHYSPPLRGIVVYYSQRIWIGYNIELAESVYSSFLRHQNLISTTVMLKYCYQPY